MTRKTNEIYRFILTYKQAHDGNSPTVREISRNIMGTCSGTPMSTSVVYYHIKYLIRDGKVRRNRNKQIEVLGKESWK